ncbi:MAG: exodeoxyribonuclease III [Parvularculaceae bacterium]
MKLATWNVNSINARLPTVLNWFRESEPDVACLQEIKCVDEKFPALEFEDMGYNIAVHGQKSYNGVALLSKYPLEDVKRGLPGDKDDEQARYVEALVTPESGKPVRIASLYLPNGNPAPGPKYDYKLKWMARLKKRAQKLLEAEESFALAGDYNVIPSDDDVHDPAKWRDDALFRLETREKFREILYLGLADALMQAHPGAHQYTFWDYKGGAWAKDWGIRIDHILLSPQAADRLNAAGVDRAARSKEKPSDHVPVWIEMV